MNIAIIPEIFKEKRELEFMINNIYCEEMSEEENELDRVSSIKKARKQFYRKLKQALLS
ncbi:MAG: hypothetical protein K6B44_05355 [Lachnospiraceae bacterium]|nr:hypothetical protein [Lachnospiraceae bacterium]